MWCSTRTTSPITTPDRKSKLRPGVVFGGPSPEHDISILTGLQAARTLGEGGIEVEVLYWSKTGEWFLVGADLEAIDFAEGTPSGGRQVQFRAEANGGFFLKRRPLDVDVILNACHGGPGEDGTLQAAFDLAGLRYTGPSAAVSALGMDKLAFGALVQSFGLPAVTRLGLDTANGAEPPFKPPFIVKPRFGGSSIGIEVVDDYETARRLVETSPHMRDGAVIEPFLVGSRDINVAVRTYPALELSALEAPARSEDGAIYSYRQKYLSGGGLEGSPRELPADLPDELADAIRTAARRLASLIGLRSVARIDFLVMGTDVFVNEVNTIPGSLAAYLWIDPPLPRLDLLMGMLTEAEAGHPRRFTTAGADGTALRTAASIAEKLG